MNTFSRIFPIKSALISVYDKTGIVDFARELSKLGIEIIATTGTYKILKKGGIQILKHVSEITNFSEILEGRIKTEHPKLIGSIIALKDKAEHMNELKRLGIKPIDLVVCNLPPLEKVIERGDDFRTVLENIDIGGPNMTRAAAKNFENVVVIIHPNRYTRILRELKETGNVCPKTRHLLAIEAFVETSRYDFKISQFLKKLIFSESFTSYYKTKKLKN